MDWTEEARRQIQAIPDKATYTGEELKSSLEAMVDMVEFEIQSYARRYALLERARKVFNTRTTQ